MERSEMLAIVLRHKGADAAEEKLAEIAHTEGDMAVMRIARDLTAAEISQIAAQGDLVKPSHLHTAITPEQFRGVFRRVGARWASADQEDCGLETIRQYQEDLNQFFCAFILLKDNEAERRELLKALFEEEHAAEALLFATIHEKDFDDFIASTGNTDFGDWREILSIVRSHFSDDWYKFMRTLSTIKEKGDYSRFVRQCAAEIYAVAMSDGGVEGGEHTEKSEEMFTPYS